MLETLYAAALRVSQSACIGRISTGTRGKSASSARETRNGSVHSDKGARCLIEYAKHYEEAPGTELRQSTITGRMSDARVELSILDNLHGRSAGGMREQFRGQYSAIDK
jgi:hypothetical protein